MSEAPGERAPRRVAQYLRMSTEHQRYSLEHQSDWIGRYIVEHGYELVRSYVDAGKSGVRMRGRSGLSSLLADVVGRRADFDLILVLDVSRWGRFLDPDQAAHYEFICREAGVEVEYCAEAFENDGTVVSALMKHFKRAMAAEYSRELSIKIATVKRGLAGKGYWQAGPAGFGLRRRILEEGGVLGAVLERGQRKAYQGQRVILTPGPPEEVALVRRIYRLFAVSGMKVEAIARLLNAEGSTPEPGHRWTRAWLRKILTSEKYAGVNVFGQHRNRLATGTSHRVPPETWLRVQGAFEPVVSRQLFEAARRATKGKGFRLSDSELLTALQWTLDDEGELSARVLQRTFGVPSASTYTLRFGGLMAAYAMIGYHRPGRIRTVLYRLTDAEMLERLADLLRVKGRLSCKLIDGSPDLPSRESYKRRFGSMAEAYVRVGYSTAQAHRSGHQDRHDQALARRAQRALEKSVKICT